MADLAMVVFEQVSAIKYPEYYRNERPVVRPEQVPNEHWHHTAREGAPEDIAQQYRGLKTLVAQGELIRNVHLYKGVVEVPAMWEWDPDG